jgi:glutamate racemase
MNKLIGLFDSGVGGLTVLKHLIKELPHEKTVYFGDMGRAPYGARSPEVIQRYSQQVVRFLVRNFEVKLLVAACNTITARALPQLVKTSPVPILGVIDRVPQKVVACTRNKRVGVIGAHSTIESGVYAKLIKHLDPDIEVFSQECGLFMPLVEEGWQNEAATRAIAESYLGLLRYSRIDTLILACTHYPILTKVIAEVMGDGVTLIDPAVECVKEVKEFLTSHNLLEVAEEADRLFYVTDKPDSFRLVGERYLDRKITNVALVDIDDLERCEVCEPAPG